MPCPSARRTVVTTPLALAFSNGRDPEVGGVVPERLLRRAEETDLYGDPPGTLRFAFCELRRDMFEPDEIAIVPVILRGAPKGYTPQLFLADLEAQDAYYGKPSPLRWVPEGPLSQAVAPTRRCEMTDPETPRLLVTKVEPKRVPTVTHSANGDLTMYRDETGKLVRVDRKQRDERGRHVATLTQVMCRDSEGLLVGLEESTRDVARDATRGTIAAAYSPLNQ
jgi:hypothetical protein